MRFSLPLEFKASDVANTGVFSGYCVSFSTVDLGGDMILPGALTATLAEHKARGSLPALLWAHDMSAPIGRITKMQEDGRGLFTEAALTLETRAAKEAYALLKDGAVSGLSIGYSVPDGGAEYRGDTRLLKQITLFEVSLVSVPMNPAARVTAVKAMDCANPRDLEHLLRESLFLSSRKAKAASNLLWPLLNERDAQDDERDARKSAAPGELAAFARELDQITKSFKGN